MQVHGPQHSMFILGKGNVKRGGSHFRLKYIIDVGIDFIKIQWIFLKKVNSIRIKRKNVNIEY
jgi:hypothetical protein